MHTASDFAGTAPATPSLAPAQPGASVTHQSAPHSVGPTALDLVCSALAAVEAAGVASADMPSLTRLYVRFSEIWLRAARVHCPPAHSSTLSVEAPAREVRDAE